MPTNSHTITAADGWVQVATAEQDFMIESRSAGRLNVTLQDAAPGPNVASHTLRKNEVMVRTGTGAAYVSTSNSLLPVYVTVTT